MKYIKENIKMISFTIIIVLGIVASVYLAQKQQIFKSKAAEINTAINVSDTNGNELEYQGNNTYKTHSQDIKIGVRNLKQLK